MMTNRQWLLEQMQNMSDEEFAYNAHDCVCDHSRCKTGRACMECKLDWLKSEHKEPIKLSDAERVILENIDKEYKWIARDGVEGVLWTFAEKPIKNNKWWTNVSNYKIGVSLNLFNHLFQFIKWEDEEAYNIEELLKGE